MKVTKFRGKRIDNGEWIYGDLLHGSYIQDGSMWIRYYDEKHQCYDSKKVHPETVGQYIGLDDLNGKEIYEADIVNYPDGYTDYAGDGIETVSTGTVEYEEEYALFYFTNRISAEMEEILDCIEEIEVIGNKYDNPELLTT